MILLEYFESKLQKQYFNNKSTTFSQVAGQELRKLQRDHWRSFKQRTPAFFKHTPIIAPPQTQTELTATAVPHVNERKLVTVR